MNKKLIIMCLLLLVVVVIFIFIYISNKEQDGFIIESKMYLPEGLKNIHINMLGRELRKLKPDLQYNDSDNSFHEKIFIDIYDSVYYSFDNREFIEYIMCGHNEPYFKKLKSVRLYTKMDEKDFQDNLSKILKKYIKIYGEDFEARVRYAHMPKALIDIIWIKKTISIWLSYTIEISRNDKPSISLVICNKTESDFHKREIGWSVVCDSEHKKKYFTNVLSGIKYNLYGK
ncbi:MAG: hypothetical protein ABH873_05310 [Candidatus Firestonebacteria bacterium]